MSTTEPTAPTYPPQAQQQPVYQPPAYQQPIAQAPYGQQPQGGWPPQQPRAARPAPAQPTQGSILRRWPAWAQNTVIIVGAVAVLVVVFFAGYFTGHATDSPRDRFGTGQNFDPRQFGGQNGLGGQGGAGS